MTAAAELALAIVGLIAVCVVLCCAVAHAVTRWLDPRRWEASTATEPDWDNVLDVLDEAEDLCRRAAAGENGWT